MERDLFMSAEAAQEMGLIDEILVNRNSTPDAPKPPAEAPRPLSEDPTPQDDPSQSP
jgi:hypothetical protein